MLPGGAFRQDTYYGAGDENNALRQGVPESAILTEDIFMNTRENIIYSLKLIESHGQRLGNLLVVTTRYHVLRALHRRLRNRFPGERLLPSGRKRY